LAREAQEKTAESERKQRQQELALKIVDTVAKDRSAARRFAIGLVKVEKVGDTEEENRSNERGRVYFLPINSRVTVGRDPDNDNDIPLREDKLGDRNRELSRFQCGFVADEHTVVVEDFASANDTLISDPSGSETRKIGGAQVKFKVVQRQQLKDRDLIWVGPFVLRFVKLQENKILAQ
jgi:pSer/pThr/pTyr-binding forkhead associated (FHA) protein